MNFFFIDSATTEIYTLSLHDALPIWRVRGMWILAIVSRNHRQEQAQVIDRKSTRLNSSHMSISYAVFCLKKKKKIILINQELLLLVYELHRSGLLSENEKIRPILAHLEKLLLCDLSPSTNDSVKN